MPSFDTFPVSDHYYVNDDNAVPIVRLDGEFEGSFGHVTERDVPSGDLSSERLTDLEDVLRRFERAVALAHLFEYLKTAERNRWHNCLVNDTSGDLRRLLIFWHYRGWWIKNRKVIDPFQLWYAGERLISYCH